MKQEIAILCATVLLLSGCGALNKSVSLEETLAESIIDTQGDAVPSSEILNTDYLLLYFSAHWCPPCQAFTPKLVEFYNTHGGGHQFQTLFISSDHTEKDMLSYIQETHMPWPAVRFHSDSANKLTKTYSGQGIPRLVLLAPSGEIIADSFKGNKYLGPQTVIEQLKKRLPKPEPTKAESTHPEPAEPTTIKPQKNLPAPDSISERFKINGFGQGAGQNIAVINGKPTIKGDELDKGIIVEEITTTYVEVSYENNRYRLLP